MKISEKQKEYYKTELKLVQGLRIGERKKSAFFCGVSALSLTLSCLILMRNPHFIEQAFVGTIALFSSHMVIESYNQFKVLAQKTDLETFFEDALKNGDETTLKTHKETRTEELDRAW